MPAVYSILITYTCNRKKTAKSNAYNNEIENPVAQILLVRIMYFLRFFVQLLFTDLIALFYCTICQCCSVIITNLTKKIQRLPPEAFGLSQQIEILKRKAEIDDILMSIQNIFSVPSLLMITKDFLSCATIIGWQLYYHSKSYRSDGLIGSVFYGVNCFGSLAAVLWFVGGIPIQLQKLKDAFHRKERQRLSFLQKQGSLQLRKELFETSEFSFTGCDIIPFRKGTFLTIIGTLLTYTVLVINMKD
ncbi:hypothetical protein AVEN_109905-1 [Araneus ventricosus]|uniref:Gustatory receptor n=1 Tax=Araneus ventricosus TaxID=182803 RepID=A0A4Y2TK73_ARAVE|nr:hypothetical protein AVEN_109905-1 [Araneus ventricosus]